ncbi:helix-turn-helix domain-containing protein [Sphaerimonospora sp. CA-214678]|uniref:helix-turn-helix domain-containing protein n=1 Tax=Sphaerimonospora sp. CA-214678 TaxID=3240029 RepID=UPI003D91E17E
MSAEDHSALPAAAASDGTTAFGASLRAARLRRGLTLRELARRTHYSHSYMSKVENGIKHPSVELAQRCDKVLDLGGELAESLTVRALAPAAPDAWPRPAQLPRGPVQFVGRTRELAELTAALLPDDSQAGVVPVVAVDGPPGVGKSALVVRWAHRNSHLFPDGVLFADLGGYGGDLQSPDAVLKVFLHELGIGGLPSVATGQPASLFRSFLHGRRLLIVLDNAADAQQVRALLPGAPGCAVVVTSRQRLSGLTVRDGAQRITLPPLGQADAVALLAEMIGRVRVGAEPEAAAAIAACCAGLPLALRLAGERLTNLPAKPLHAFAAELAAEEHALDMLTVLGDPRSAVRTVFSWSYLALAPADARVFQQLGLHPSAEFSITAATAVTGLPPVETERALERLAAAHLIEPVGPQRYRLHNPLRLYARERARA